MGKDVTQALGYSKGKALNNAIAKHVDQEDKGCTEMMTPGGKQTVIIINESGLYALILSSGLPSAKKFKRWITAEVLPSLRKNGAYLTQEAQEQITAAVQGQIAEVVAQTVPAVVAEVMKQVLPVLIDNSKTNSNATKEPERKRNRVRIVSKVDFLPLEVKSKVMEMLIDPRYRYDEIVAYCKEENYPISRSALCRYSQKLQKQFGAYKITMEEQNI